MKKYIITSAGFNVKGLLEEYPAIKTMKHEIRNMNCYEYILVEANCIEDIISQIHLKYRNDGFIINKPTIVGDADWEITIYDDYVE